MFGRFEQLFGKSTDPSEKVPTMEDVEAQVEVEQLAAELEAEEAMLARVNAETHEFKAWDAEKKTEQVAANTEVSKEELGRLKQQSAEIITLQGKKNPDHETLPEHGKPKDHGFREVA